MDPTALVHPFFAIAPWALFAGIVIAVYLASRGERRAQVPIGQTFSCANCGHRDKREHMVPVARAGSVVWYCPHCATRA